jgi:uncharacterized protein DUF4386
MESTQRTGRGVGLLLLIQLAGLIVPFVLLHPLTRGTQNYLAHAVESAVQIRVAVFLLLANCALTIGISIAVFRVFCQHSESAALWLLAVSVIMFLLQAVDNVHVLSMLSLSQQYSHAGGEDALPQALAAVVGSTRRWAHLTELLVIDCWLFSLYGILYRLALVPRALAGFGLFTVLLHCAGIPLRGLLGYAVVMPMGVAMGVSQIALAIWLLAKGFRERADDVQAG